MPREVRRERTDEERDREFHLIVREALLLFLRGYERRYLPDLNKGDRQTKGNRGIG